MTKAEQLVKKLETADPSGRLDIALFKIADRLAKKLIPADWPVLRQVAAKMLNEQFGPRKKKRAHRRPK